ncbi:MAG: DUF58 domain-containing protein [DPANN group archaeon]|nr:DUF58 domain-containing protein [DPANN group archaeon]
MIDLSILKELEKFDLVIKRKITSKYSGDRKSNFLGRGTVMSDHRIYSPGDDFRSIDWKIFARTDDLYVKRYDEDRSLVVNAVVDSSKSMDYGAKTRKFDYAALLGIGFCYLAMKNNEKFRIATFGDDLTLFPTSLKGSQLGSMVDHLDGLQLSGSSNFEGSMVRYRRTIGSRSFIVIISDFLFDVKEFRNGIMQFPQHDVHLIQVLDPSEVHLDLEGDFFLRDMESGDQLRTSVTPRLKSHYQDRLQEHIHLLQDTAKELKARFWTVTTDKPIFDVFWDVLR